MEKNVILLPLILVEFAMILVQTECLVVIMEK